MEPAAPPVGVWQPLSRNLRAGLRTALLLPTKRADVVASWGQFGVLMALAIVSTASWSLVATGFPARFNYWAVPYAVFFLPLVILASLGIAGMARRTEEVLWILVPVLAAELWIEGVLTLLELALASMPLRSVVQWAPWVAFYAGPVWLATCIDVTAARQLNLAWSRRAMVAPVAFVVVAWPLLSADFASSLWIKADTRQAVDERLRDAAVREDVLYLQPKLLEQAVAALAPPEAGRPSLYLVGVAGYSGQDVFRREVDAVDDLFTARFGTRGRSLKLVNNGATVRDTPIASRTWSSSIITSSSTLSRHSPKLYGSA